jgi:adenosine/AMP kinase
MSFSYTIIAFNEAAGSVLVRYKFEEDDLATYNVDIPLDENNLFITGDVLDKHISGLFPLGVLDRRSKLKKGIANAADIRALVVKPNE